MPLSLKEKAILFRNLNEQGKLLLPNAWDAASARIFETAGFPAIGTTSAGVSYAFGMRDGEQMDRTTSICQSSRIAGAVSVPVTADIESGYGRDAESVRLAVASVLNSGIVGINLEDNTHANSLYDIDEQVKRIAAARAEAEEHDLALTINARTDTFLLGLGRDDDERLALTVVRGKAYLGAGADLIFVPTVIDPTFIGKLADAFDGKLSVMAMPGAPSADELFKAGACRVSIGQTAMLASLGLISKIAEELKSSGTWSSMEKTFFGFAEAEALFSKEENQ